jgi:hypothetical protein
MEKELETIFAHAVALEQAGRMKNTIYCYGKEIFILNYDKTILLRFELSPMVKPFESAVGFNANDYDSSKFSEKDGKIVFFRSGGGFERKKSCAVPGKNFNEVKSLFEKFWNGASNELIGAKINLDKEVLSLLEEDLSHIEFSSENKKLVILQRDLYSGTIIRIDRKKEGGLGLSSAKDSIAEEFGPVGIRTNDLIALFSFSRDLNILFPPAGKGYSLINGMSGKMQGILAWCLYDEIGNIAEVINHGRQEPQERNDQQAVGGAVSSRRRKVL